MKTLSKLSVFSLLLVAGVMSFSSCNKKSAVTSSAKEVSIPFDGSKYRSDKDYFRARGTGTSPDLSTSKKIAMQNGRTEMAASIEAVLKAVTDQYTNQRTFSNAQEFNSRFEELSRTVVNQTLNDVRVMDEKAFEQEDGRFQYWVALEMSREALSKSINDRVSREDALRQDFDRQKFQEIFDAEMNKLRQERP